MSLAALAKRLGRPKLDRLFLSHRELSSRGELREDRLGLFAPPAQGPRDIGCGHLVSPSEDGQRKLLASFIRVG